MLKLIFPIVGSVLTVLILTSCTTLTTAQYEATAITTYTWVVRYSNNINTDKVPRLETFASTSLVNHNGLKPAGASTGPDYRGLWWPVLPPQPTVDQIEQRQGTDEEASKPELLKSVTYQISFRVDDKNRTLPTNYQVYREAVKADAAHTPLRLTLGIGGNSVEKAEPD